MRNLFFILLFSNILYSLSFSSFYFIENKMIEENKIFFEQIQVTKDKNYNNFGDLEKLKIELVPFFISIGNDHQRAEKAATIVSDLVFESLRKIDAPTGWVTIRASLPNDSFKIPRWHTDGGYYKPFSGAQKKIACTLKGPGTLFCNPLEDVRKEFNKIREENKYEEKSRPLLAELLKNEEILKAPVCQSVVFIVCDKETSAIYSEPFINEPRLFMSIVPGTDEQIKELYDRWHPNNNIFIKLYKSRFFFLSALFA